MIKEPMYMCALCEINFQEIDTSGMCYTCLFQQTQAQIKKQQNQKGEEKLNCPQCTVEIKKNDNKCQVCSYVFKESGFHDIEKESQMTQCKKCNFQNHISNQACLNCEEELYESTKKKCEVCGFKIKQTVYPKHLQECQLSKKLLDQEQKQMQKNISPVIIRKYPIIHRPIKVKPIIPNINIQKIPNKPIVQNNVQALKNYSCLNCMQDLSEKNRKQHHSKCPKKYEYLNRIKDPKERLTPLQCEALAHMYQVSAKSHHQIEQKQVFINRVKKLGYSKQDLQNLNFYIENYAPIIIQIHVSRHMEFFVKDTHYRSQFQTNKSSGSLSRSSRTQWEDRMFYNKYQKATDPERVKYGVINFTNDPKGVQCAASYGLSYLLLKSHVRQRCTMTSKDSSGADAIISNLINCHGVLQKMNDNQLKAAFNGSKALQESSSVVATYKEIQIHGPVEFAKDVQRIYVSKKQIAGNKKLLDMANSSQMYFLMQQGCNYSQVEAASFYLQLYQHYLMNSNFYQHKHFFQQNQMCLPQRVDFTKNERIMNKQLKYSQSYSQNSDQKIKAESDMRNLGMLEIGQDEESIQQQNLDPKYYTSASKQRFQGIEKAKKQKKISKQQRKARQTKRNQTQNSKRNVLPNEIHQMLSILFKRKKSQKIVEKLILRYSKSLLVQNLSVTRFYLYQSLLKQKIGHYANKETLKKLLCPLQPNCNIYAIEQQRVYARVGLILVKHFLDNQAAVNIFNSKRIKTKNRLDHLMARKYLNTALSQIIQEESSDFLPKISMKSSQP